MIGDFSDRMTSSGVQDRADLMEAFQVARKAKREIERTRKGLTARQEQFVKLYISGPAGVRFNATASAREAGYAWPSRQGARLTTFPEVAWFVEILFKIRHELARNPDGGLKRKRRKCM